RRLIDELTEQGIDDLTSDLALSLSTLAKPLGAPGAFSLARALVSRLPRAKRPLEAVPLSNTLAALSDSLRPADAAPLARDLADKLAGSSVDQHESEAIAFAVSALARRAGSAEVAPLARKLTKEMTGMVVRRGTDVALSALAAGLEPTDAAPLAHALANKM